jgi:hypothetical protein
MQCNLQRGCSWGRCPSPFAATNLKQRDMSGVIAGSQLEEGGVAGQFGETASMRTGDPRNFPITPFNWPIMMHAQL